MVQYNHHPVTGPEANSSEYQAMDKLRLTLPIENESGATTARSATNRLPVSTPPCDAEGHPAPEWVRGCCPECGTALVSNMYYIGGQGYLVVWECWASLGEDPHCDYRRVL